MDRERDIEGIAISDRRDKGHRGNCHLGRRGIEGTTVKWDRGARGIEKTVISNSGTLREL